MHSSALRSHSLLQSVRGVLSVLSTAKESAPPSGKDIVVPQFSVARQARSPHNDLDRHLAVPGGRRAHARMGDEVGHAGREEVVGRRRKVLVCLRRLSDVGNGKARHTAKWPA